MSLGGCLVVLDCTAPYPAVLHCLLLILYRTASRCTAHVYFSLPPSLLWFSFVRSTPPSTVSTCAVGLITKRAEQLHRTSACQDSLDPCRPVNMTGTVHMVCKSRSSRRVPYG